MRGWTGGGGTSRPFAVSMMISELLERIRVSSCSDDIRSRDRHRGCESQPPENEWTYMPSVACSDLIDLSKDSPRRQENGANNGASL